MVMQIKLIVALIVVVVDPHSKLKADENSAYLPGYSMKNSRKHSFHRNPFMSRGFPHASQNGICRPEMRNFHIMFLSCFKKNADFTAIHLSDGLFPSPTKMGSKNKSASWPNIS